MLQLALKRIHHSNVLGCVDQWSLDRVVDVIGFVHRAQGVNMHVRGIDGVIHHGRDHGGPVGLVVLTNRCWCAARVRHPGGGIALEVDPDRGAVVVQVADRIPQVCELG